MLTFQEILRVLSTFWEKHGCVIHQGYDLELGAGTFNPATFLRSLGPEPYRAAYIEPSRRPTDGRYGTNPNRLQHYFQYQVILKPSPDNIQDLYLQSLQTLGFDLKHHDIRFVHDDWESPTLGAWGLGWEVWMDGMEVSQFTYFQAVGGVELRPITGEITYGIERLAMYLQQVNSIYDLQWSGEVTYGDIYQRNEVEWSHYNFTKADAEMWLRHFEDYEREAKKLIQDKLPLPAYDFVIKASHAFNLLDARGVISVTERTGYIARIRELAKLIAESYVRSREEQGFPLLKKFKSMELHEPEDATPAEKIFNIHSDDREDFLLEIGSEELPAEFVTIGSRNLEANIRSLLDAEGIRYDRIKTYATPRRLAVYVHQLAMGKPAQITEKKGPAVDQAYTSDGKLTPAGAGFFRSLGFPPPSLEALRQKTIPGIELRPIKEQLYLYGHIKQEGRATAAILHEKLPQLIIHLEFPKKMRWGVSEITYARPLKWIVALFGSHVIPFHVGTLRSGRKSRGHRQLAPTTFELANARDYIKVLRQHSVIADPVEREESILNQLSDLESKHHFTIIQREKVIPQVLNLVEWPYLTVAEFQSHFLKAPQEVLISEMVEHQKYFPVTSHEGTLINKFVITANVVPTDQIRSGNQRVLSARLADGIFLYEEDLKMTLTSFNEKLKKVIFQKDLGTVYQKVERMRAHAKSLRELLNISTSVKVDRAALLCKADLASNMVYEFPELQGTIGKYYAMVQHEDPEVASAIDEHWMPRGEKAPLPKTETGVVLSLADKFDNLIGCFGIGLKPSSSSDPYALRRQVLGMIKILIHEKQSLPLDEAIQSCIDHFAPGIIKAPKQVSDDLLQFIINRIKTVFLDYGFHKDEIEASLSRGTNDIYDTFCRVQALHEFRQNSKEQFNSLYEVYKRARGQLDGKKHENIKQATLVEPAEIELYETLLKQQQSFQEAIHKHKYRDAYALIAKIQPPLAQLFEKVKILADDPEQRENRLSLLQKVFDMLDQILEFSKIQSGHS